MSRIKTILFSLVYTSVITFVVFELSFGLIPLGLFSSFIILIGTLISGLVIKLFARNQLNKVYNWLFLSSLLTLMIIFIFFASSRFQHSITENRATEIISSLSEYRNEHQDYPTSLSELKPIFLNSIPTTGYGILQHNFEYKHANPNEFWLFYYSYIGVEYRYSSRTKLWSVDD